MKEKDLLKKKNHQNFVKLEKICVTISTFLSYNALFCANMRGFKFEFKNSVPDGFVLNILNVKFL